MPRPYYGKYRGRVERNVDPKQLGRLQVSCPAILGDGKQSWALPCTPYAGKGVGWFALPPVGAQVWVEFEGGDPDYPIWSGCFWLPGEVPATPAEAAIKVFKTDHVLLEINEGDEPSRVGVRLELDDKKVPNALKIVLNSQGIEINHGDTRIVRLTADRIEIVHSDQAKVVVTEKDVELASDPVSVKLVPGDPSVQLAAGSTTSAHWSGDGIQLKQGEATLKLSSAGIEQTNGPGVIKVTTQGVELGASPAIAKIQAAGIDLTDGTGAAIKLSGPSVNVNNGALEVM